MTKKPYRVSAENAHTEKPKTNADRIRSMTDEELGEKLSFGCLKLMETEKCRYPTEGLKCKACILQWLKEESEE